MAELARAFEAAGFTSVKTVLASGNVVFDASTGKEDALEEKAEAAMQAELGRVFMPMVRSIEHLEKMVADDPFSGHGLSKDAKYVVSFVRAPAKKLKLPAELGKAKIVSLKGREIYTAYEPEGTPVFMTLIEKTFGKEVTTRTWQTVQKVIAKARAADAPAKKAAAKKQSATMKGVAKKAAPRK